MSQLFDIVYSDTSSEIQITGDVEIYVAQRVIFLYCNLVFLSCNNLGELCK